MMTPTSTSTSPGAARARSASASAAVLIAVLLVFSLGCEASVNPYVGGAAPYTLWGIMNAGADTQVVRVFTVDGRAGIDRSGDIDAVVTSSNLTTGETHTWTHKEVSYEDGDMGHVFWAPFRAEHGHDYRLEVKRSDGETSTVEVSIPEPVEIEIDTDSRSSRVPVLVKGDIGNILGAEVRYEATNLPPIYVFPPDRAHHPPVFHPVHISYDDEGQRVEEGLRFYINLQRDAGLVRKEYEGKCLVTNGAPGIALRRVEFRFVAASDAWSPPGGTFDPEVLVQPDAFSNVENGYGFIGAGKAFKIRWIPVSEVRDFLGYTYDRLCSMFISDTPACNDPPIPCFEENYESIWEVYF